VGGGEKRGGKNSGSLEGGGKKGKVLDREKTSVGVGTKKVSKKGGALGTRGEKTLSEKKVFQRKKKLGGGGGGSITFAQTRGGGGKKPFS